MQTDYMLIVEVSMTISAPNKADAEESALALLIGNTEWPFVTAQVTEVLSMKEVEEQLRMEFPG